ncbi:hypothetical protein ACWD7F_29340 [Streptomyces sp. NPDC005122]
MNLLLAEVFAGTPERRARGPAHPTGREVRVHRTGLAKDPLVSGRKGSLEGAIGVR